MATSFLLRFQEPCFLSDEYAVQYGTQTKTYVRAEQPDSDRSPPRYSAISGWLHGSGTQTFTRVKSEQSDSDRCSTALAIPITSADRTLGTKTLTAIRAETTDDDPAESNLQVIPRCCSH